MSKHFFGSIKQLGQGMTRGFGRYWRASWWHKSLVILAGLALLCIGTGYGIARWYIASQSSKPLQLGVSFIPSYAESLGLEPKATMDALIGELGVRHFRLVSYWSQLEPAPGKYDFSLLDWQFEKAEADGATVSLALGLRQPRWPECHLPDWAKNLPAEQWQPRLNDFIAATVERYKDSQSLISYQLENEYFLKVFSPACTDYSRERLVSEYNLVKRLDPQHPVIMARSNNYGQPLGEPVPDIYGFSVYRRVWDTKTKRYFQYPLPPKWYAFHAGLQQIIHGKPSVLHELQAEAWPPQGQPTALTSLEEQNKSIDAQRLADTFQFGIDTGMREIYLWGAEYWYYRMVVLDDPSLWDVAKAEFSQP